MLFSDAFERLPRIEASQRTAFAANRLDRLGARRAEKDLTQTLRALDGARLVLVSQDGVMRSAKGSFPDGASEVRFDPQTLVFLGVDGQSPVFSAMFTGDIKEGEDSIGLRALLTEEATGPQDLGILAQARSMSFWHHRHRFCANCGALTQLADNGWKRVCAACSSEHFPRTDPVTIMLIIDPATGDVLLGRQPHFPEGVYSTLAGFVEPGETIEDGVRREVMEEAGIAVGKVRYIASQPWPFPSSLMIGCHGEALTRAITLDEAEMEDARFFTRDEVRAMAANVGGEGKRLPSRFSVAYALIALYLEDETPAFT